MESTIRVEEKEGENWPCFMVLEEEEWQIYENHMTNRWKRSVKMAFLDDPEEEKRSKQQWWKKMRRRGFGTLLFFFSLENEEKEVLKERIRRRKREIRGPKERKENTGPKEWKVGIGESIHQIREEKGEKKRETPHFLRLLLHYHSPSSFSFFLLTSLPTYCLNSTRLLHALLFVLFVF